MKNNGHSKENVLVAILIGCGLSLFIYSIVRVGTRVNSFETSIAMAHAEKENILDETYGSIISMTKVVPATVPTLKHVLAEALQNKNVREKTVVNYLMAMKLSIHPGLYGEILKLTTSQKLKMLSASNKLESRTHRYRLYLNTALPGKVLRLFGYPRIQIEAFERPLMWPETIPSEKFKNL